MTPQVVSFYLYLALAALILGVFAAVAWSTRRPREVSVEAVRRWRAGFFVLVAVTLVGSLGFTLGRVPYDFAEGEIPAHTVFLAGKQFAFAVSTAPITSEDDWLAGTTSAPVQVGAGQLVEFRVTTLDVNHNMGFFDPAGTLIGQVQAMPGYLNRLRMRFPQPGRYLILCLELCGNGHSRMRAVVDVTAPRI